MKFNLLTKLSSLFDVTPQWLLYDKDKWPEDLPVVRGISLATVVESEIKLAKKMSLNTMNSSTKKIDPFAIIDGVISKSL